MMFSRNTDNHGQTRSSDDYPKDPVNSKKGGLSFRSSARHLSNTVVPSKSACLVKTGQGRWASSRFGFKTNLNCISDGISKPV